MDKVASTAIARIAFAIAGRTWGDIAQRSLTYTPTGGQTTTVETLAVRAFSDGTTPTDALLFDLSNGTGDLRAGSATMASGTSVDLGSAPMKKVAITGGAGVVINSFGPGRHLERIVRFTDAGATLVHSATSLDLPGGANIVVRAGDRLLATSDGSGNWRVVAYCRADGKALVSPTPAEAGAQPALGFTPVQQGGGPGQLSNKIYVGWSGDALKGSVDGVDLGNIWSDFLSVKNFTTNGYIKFPSGFIVQWGRAVPTVSDYLQVLNTNYPGSILGAIAYMEGGTPGDRVYLVTTDQFGNSGFAVRTRIAINGGTVAANANQPVRWISWGY